MSDLPSRDAVAEALTFAPLTDAGADPIYDIARAYVHGGRLVDREAIDYEAAGRRVEPLLDWPDDDVSAFVAYAETEGRAIVAAAMEDGNE